MSIYDPHCPSLFDLVWEDHLAALDAAEDREKLKRLNARRREVASHLRSSRSFDDGNAPEWERELDDLDEKLT